VVNPIKRMTEQELLKTLQRLINENPVYDDVLKCALDEGTSDIGLLCSIVDEFQRRENKELIQSNYIAHNFYNHKLDEYQTTPTTEE